MADRREAGIETVNSMAVVSMIVIGGFVWGGFLILLAYGIRHEKRKDPDRGSR